MDVILATRALGKALQETPEYAHMMEAQKACDDDIELQNQVEEFNLVRIQLSMETQKQDKNADKLQELNEKVQSVYNSVMGNENMVSFNIAKQDLDVLMQQVQGILTLCLSGEDPDTCEAPTCTGSCASCAGCH